MAKKLLGKVVAGAALGGASLLVCTPGIAVADDHHRKDEGKVFAKPHAVEAGHEVKLLEICPKPQEHAYVWSKVTGKVDLKPAHDRRDGKGYRDMGGRDYKRDHKGEDYKRDHKGGRDGSDAEGREHHDYKRDHKGGYGDSQAEGRGWGDESHSGYGQAEGRGWGDDKRDHKGDWGADDAEGREHHDYKRDHKGEDYKRDHKGEDYKRDHKGDWDADDAEGREHHDYKRDHKGDRDADDAEGRGGDRWEHKRDYIYYGEATVDRNAKPGTYKLEGSCGEGELVVLPRGGVDGGDGGMSAGTNRGLAAGGAGLLGAAALGGLVLLRRRTDGSLV